MVEPIYMRPLPGYPGLAVTASSMGDAVPNITTRHFPYGLSVEPIQALSAVHLTIAPSPRV